MFLLELVWFELLVELWLLLLVVVAVVVVAFVAFVVVVRLLGF